MANVTVCVPGFCSGGATSSRGGGEVAGVPATVGATLGVGDGVPTCPPEFPAEWRPGEHAASTSSRARKVIRMVVSKTRASPYWSDYIL
jgi:hypothetical protein